MYDFPFNISDISYLLNLTIRRKTEFSEQVDCPFCEGQGKMRLDIPKNQFRCPKCDESGGMLQLYAKVINSDTKTAYKEICDNLKVSQKSRNRQIIKNSNTTNRTDVCSVANNEKADEITLHNTYSNFLSMLSLSETHRKKLLERGLTDIEINSLGYKSITKASVSNIACQLVERGCTLKNVPGFYTDKDGNWKLNFSSNCDGILIPIMSINKRIQGFQIRLNQPYKNTKYIWLSSSYDKGVPLENGTSSGSPVHFVGNFNDGVAYVTEGALKGDIANNFSNKSFLCVAGVNQYKSLDIALLELKQKGITTIVESYDMDKYTNKYVENGSLKLIEKANQLGFEVHRLKWDKKYKGIDDYLYYKKRSINEE